MEHAAKDACLKSRWEILHTKKTTILSLCEKYAAHTLPYIFPEDNTDDATELPLSYDSIGAQGVNHLSNRIISTLFPAKSLFFRLNIDQETRDMLEQAIIASEEASTPEDVKAMLVAAIQDAESELLKAEKKAEQHLNMIQYRPQAIQAMKLLIITGNAMVYHPEKGPVQIYNLRNYHVLRDCSGQVVEIMTREKKDFGTFSPEIQDILTGDARHGAMYQRIKKAVDTNTKGYSEDTEVTIYTQIKLHTDGLFHVRQFADQVDLNVKATYKRDTLRWIPLVWNLIAGEDYGRGLVGDFTGAFEALRVLNGSLLNLAGVAGDIKFFADPSSLVDVQEVNSSLPGSWHVGKPNEIGTPQLNIVNNMQLMMAAIERYEKQIAQAFMLTQQLTRQAERVTAEEIRRDVDELETSNAGIYSRMAAGWQVQTANLALQDTGFIQLNDGINADIITGLDSLSRAGEAYNMRLFLSDLGMLNAVPEDVRAAMKPNRFIKRMGSLHSVDYEDFVMTDTELRAAQNAEFERQQTLQAQQGQQSAETEMAREAAKE